MTIAQILGDKGGDVVHAAPGTTLEALIALLTERRIGAVPVVEDGEVVGVMSERDVVHAVSTQGAAALGRPIRLLMSQPAITVSPDTSLLAGLALMTRRRIRHLPVVSDGRMIGIVSIGDLVKARIDRIEAEAAAMRSYIAS